eukprot:Gb_22974 [translate_table: standard]
MPFCEVNNYQQGIFSEGIKIFYEQYGHGDIKVLLIIGLAGTHDSWGPQIKGLTGIDLRSKEKEWHAKEGEGEGPKYLENDPHGRMFSGSEDMQELLVCNKDKEMSLRNAIQVCSFDNRGVGQSSMPKQKSYYTTSIMARDALALLDHLGWKKAHVIGHSMGAMIACKLAAIAPDRISSLALLNATGGGLECLPKVDRTLISIVLRFLKARTPEERADVDLDTHYTKEFLEAYVGSTKRRAILYEEYVRNLSATGVQSKYGFEGHVNACWTHKITSSEYETIRTSGFLIAVIHGRQDIIAQVRHARQIAKKLYPVARMVELHGAHLVSHEKPDEVNQVLMELIKASESNMQPLEWMILSHPEMGWGMQETWSASQREKGEEENHSCTACIFSLYSQLQTNLFYLWGLFVTLWEYLKQILFCSRRERVGLCECDHASVSAQDLIRTPH